METATSVRAHARNRSRLANSPERLAGVDMRTANGRRYRDLIAVIGADLTSNGPPLSDAEAVVVRQAAALAMQAEQLGARLVRGEPVDAEALARISGVQASLVATLKTKRRSRKTRSDRHG